MKLVDILARELKVWPENCECVWQVLSGRLAIDKDRDRLTDSTYTIARDWHEARVTRAEWQAAVDALNQSELDAVLAKNEQLAAARAERIPVWNGEGFPPVGAICEYDARPVERGDPLFVTVKVKYVSDQSIVIICTDVPDGENKENIGVELALMNGISMLGKFRAIRTAEQVAAEEREKAINEMMMHGVDAGDSTIEYSCAALYDAGYRKEPKPCGS